MKTINLATFIFVSVGSILNSLFVYFLLSSPRMIENFFLNNLVCLLGQCLFLSSFLKKKNKKMLL